MPNEAEAADDKRWVLLHYILQSNSITFPSSNVSDPVLKLPLVFNYRQSFDLLTIIFFVCEKL